MTILDNLPPDAFEPLCCDILRGLGMPDAENFAVKGIPHAFRAKLVRESSDGMFRSDDTQLCLFAQAASPLNEPPLQAIGAAAAAAQAGQVLLVVFGEVSNDAAQDLRATLDKESIPLNLLSGALAETLALDFGSHAALRQHPRPLAFSFARLRLSARQQMAEAPWRKRFQTVPIQPARVVPLHAEDAALSEADLFRALRGGSFLLLGEPGAGKTTSLLALAGDIAQSGAQTPLFVPLGRYQGELAALLGEILGDGQPLLPTVIADLLASGALTLLLDGINEVQEPELHTQLVAELNRYTAPEQPSRHCRWIVSGRVHDYQQSRSHLRHLESRRWEMQALSPDLVFRYLADALGEAEAETLYQELGGAVREICANPLLLNMMLEVYQSTGTAPSGRGALYRDFIRLLLAWGQDRSLGGDRREALAEWLPSSRDQACYERLVEEALTALAAAMLTTFTPWDTARQQLAAGLPASSNPLKAAALLLEDLVRHGILRQHSYNRLSFYHHTFQEYFLARTLAGESPECLIPKTGVSAERREAVLFLASAVADPQPLLRRAMEVDLGLAYDLLRSLPTPTVAVLAKELAGKLWAAARANGGYMGANRSYARLFQRLAGMLGTAVESLAQELDHDLDQESQIRNLARFYEELGDADAQQRVLAPVIEGAAVPDGLLWSAAAVAYDKADYQGCVEFFSRYLEQNPKNASALNNRALALEMLGRKQEARADYERALALEDDSVIRTNYAVLLHDLGEKDLAIEQARLALQQAPAFASAHDRLADWLETQEPETALAHREQAVRHAPHEEALRRYCRSLADLQETLGHHAAAIRSLRRLVELEPTSGQVQAWKQRIARLRQALDLQERTQSARQRLQEQGELPLPLLAAEWLKAAGLQVIAATGTELLAEGKGLADPLPLLLLPEAEITPAVLWDALAALPRQAKKTGQVMMLSAADSLSLEARQQLAALQDGRSVAFITALEVRDALLQSDRACRLLLDRALQRASGQNNPFDYKGVVLENTEFFGRVRELDELIGLLNRGQPLGLYGIHKIGKSSLLEQLRRRLHISHPQFSVLKLELDSNIRSAPELYLRILETLPDNLELRMEQGISHHPFRQALEAYHRKREQNRPGHRILLILDEYAYMLPNHKGVGGMHDFVGALSLFKTLTQEGWFSFLPCGRTAAINRQASWGDQENPFVDLLSPRFLGPLPSNEHDSLLTSLGTRAGLVFHAEALPLLYAETGGHPGFTRSLGSQLLQDGKQPVTPERVASGIEHFLADRDKKAILLAIYEQRLDDEEQKLARQLALDGPQPRSALFPTDADTERRRHIRDALANLLDTYVLQELDDGRIAHRYGLLRRIIEKEAKELGY